MKKLIFPLVIVVLLFWIFADKCNYSSLSSDFKVKQDSLVQTVDSLQKDIHQKDLEISALNELDYDLQVKLDNAKAKVIIVNKWVDSSKDKVDIYSEKELISSFNQRYPADTVTNPLPLAQPVLISAAKDLVELDGAKEQLIIKDSIIVLNEERIANKDSVIDIANKKELNYNNIVVNQETQIKDWKVQYNALQLKNHKLKIQAKVGKIGAGLIIAGLTFLLVK